MITYGTKSEPVHQVLSPSAITYPSLLRLAILHMSSCSNINNFAVANGWEQHAVNTDGTLHEASKMDWTEPDDQDQPLPNIGMPSSI